MINDFKSMGSALPLLWHDKVTIYGVVDEDDGIFTENRDTLIVKDEPAKIILKGLKASNQSEFGTDDYDAKLLIRNGIKIPAGADIFVTDVNGGEVKYKQSSRGYIGYISHQEVALIRSEKAKEEVDNGLGKS